MLFCSSSVYSLIHPVALLFHAYSHASSQPKRKENVIGAGDSWYVLFKLIFTRQCIWLTSAQCIIHLFLMYARMLSIYTRMK